MTDGTREVLRQELHTILNALVSGNKPQLKPEKHSYFDHAREEQELLRSPEGAANFAYWQENLADPPHPITLPAQDHPRPPTLTFEGLSIRSIVPEEIHSQLSGIAREENISEFSLFLSVFAYQLHDYSRRDDLILGSFSAGRGRAEYASTVGYFVNPVIIRSVKTEATDTFDQWLRLSARQSREALDHADAPFPWLVEKLKPERQPNRSPFFDISFNFLTRKAITNIKQKQGKQSDLETFDFRQADGKFDLTLTLLEDNGQLQATFGYNCHLFEESTIRHFAEDYQMLLRTFANDPQTRFSDLNNWQRTAPPEIVTPEPCLQGPTIEIAADQCLTRLFEQQVVEHPNSPAYSNGIKTLSYAKLDQAANELAQNLSQRGFQTGDVIAIGNQSSDAALCSIIAVLKIGATYLPLDPSQYPADLLQYMVQTAGALAVLVDSEAPKSLTSLEITAVRFTVDDLLSRPKATDTPVAVRLEDTAYIIFTSGSTGRPKAVPISHRSVANYILSMMPDLSIEERARFALVSTLAADLGNTMLFLSLVSGGTLYVMPEPDRLNARRFAIFMQDNAVDYLKIVPSHWKTLLQTQTSTELFPRKSLILGGEGADYGWIREIRKLAPHCQIYNHYGPTEATIGVLSHPLQAFDDNGALPATLPLSQCIANTGIYILDTDLQAVSKGETGEVYIAGDCLSSGYHGDSKANQRAFVQLPGSNGPRAYKTGDLARQQPNGTLELLGRSDRQIQLRGFRIEPLQVETALQESGWIKQSVATVKRAGTDYAQLVAFVVPKADQNLQELPKLLGDWAGKQLPEQMVPGLIHPVKRIPLNPNGKADIKQLLDNLSNGTETGFAEAQTDLERTLQDIWKETLEVDTVGIHDNFFETGGHSLLAVKLLATIEERLEAQLSLQEVLSNTTISQQAKWISTAEDSIESILTPLLPNTEGEPIVCIPGAGGSILYYNELARLLQPDYTLWGLQGVGLSERKPEESGIEATAAFYLDELKQAPFARQPYTLIGHSYGGLVAYEMVRQLGTEAAGNIKQLGILDNPAPSAMHERPYESWDTATWLIHIVTRMQKLYHIDLQLSIEGLRKLNHDQQITLLHNRLLSHKVLSDHINARALGKYVQVYRDNAMATLQYQPDALSVDLPITLYKAQESDVDLGEMSSSQNHKLNWQDYSPATVNVIEVPGTHLSMMTAPHVTDLATALRNQEIENMRAMVT
ncbi:MAG: amino acid adenylation domain-containing protein [Verrucomicrobiota bacterium]